MQSWVPHSHFGFLFPQIPVPNSRCLDRLLTALCLLSGTLCQEAVDWASLGSKRGISSSQGTPMCKTGRKQTWQLLDTAPVISEAETY